MTRPQTAGQLADTLRVLGASPRRVGTRWSARCPLHTDDVASLTFSDGRSQLLVHCFGCGGEGTRAEWLRRFWVRLDNPEPLPPARPGARGRGGGGGSGVGVPVATYPYVRADGTVVATHVRYVDAQGRKSMPWWRPVGDGWAEGLGRLRLRDLPLYGLPAVLERPDGPVLVVEGEKDVDTAAAHGLLAVSGPGGAGSPLVDDLEALRGRSVIIVADRDPAGTRCARTWAAALAGVAAGVRLARCAADIPGGDLTDHLEAGGTLATLDYGPQPVTQAVEVPSQGPVPYMHSPDMWAQHPQLEHVRAYALARAVSPDAVLLGVLVRLVLRLPPEVTLPGPPAPASLNLLGVLAGPPGSGKDAACDVAGQLVPLESGVLETCVGSGEGLAECYAVRERDGTSTPVRTTVLLTVSEADELTVLSGRQGQTLGPVLRKAAMGQALGNASKVGVRVLPHSYRLGLLLCLQPARAGAMMGAASVDGGTPQRYVYASAVCPELGDPGVPVPQDPGVLLLPELRYVLGAVWVCPEALGDVALARRVAHGGGLDGAGTLDGHALLLRLKVAVAVGVLCVGSPDVTAWAWDVAGRVMAVSDAVRDVCVRLGQEGALAVAAELGAGDAARAAGRTHTTEEAVDRVGLVMLRHLDGAGPEGLGWAELRKRVAMRDRGWCQGAVDELLRSGRVVAVDVAGGRRYVAGEL